MDFVVELNRWILPYEVTNLLSIIQGKRSPEHYLWQNVDEKTQFRNYHPQRRRPPHVGVLSANRMTMSHLPPLGVTSPAKPVSPSIQKPVIQTRKKPSPLVTTNDSSTDLQKASKAPRKRRRTDPFTRMSTAKTSFLVIWHFLIVGKRRMTKPYTRKTRQKIDLSSLVPVPPMEQTLSPTESLIPSVQSSLSFTYESSLPPNTPMTKYVSLVLSVFHGSSHQWLFRRIGRIRIQRCVDGATSNATVRLISTGESNTRLSLPSQTTLAASTLLTNLISARRSNSLNNITSNPSSS